VGQKRHVDGEHRVVTPDGEHVADELLDGRREAAAGPSAPAATAPLAAWWFAVAAAAHPSQSFRSAPAGSRPSAGAGDEAFGTAWGQGSSLAATVSAPPWAAAAATVLGRRINAAAAAARHLRR